MTTCEARALTVKMLNETEIQKLHEMEEKLERYLFPHEIVKIFRKRPVKKYWSIPDDTISQSVNTEDVRTTVSGILTKNKISADMTNEENRFNFDWHIKRADVDFTYKGKKKNTNTEMKDEDIFK